MLRENLLLNSNFKIDEYFHNKLFGTILISFRDIKVNVTDQFIIHIEKSFYFNHN